MRILALDLSLTATGWATSVDEHGCETTPGKLRGVNRLYEWGLWLHDLAGGGRGVAAFEVAVIEGYAFGARGRAMFSIGEWGGVARLTLFSLAIPFVEIPPAVLKKFATGRGNAPKPDLRMELYKRSGLDVADDNTVDALWLLAAASHAYNEPLWAMPKAQVEALAKVDWPGPGGGP